jgi:DNA mismatch endonuclease (patch repair protein)
VDRLTPARRSWLMSRVRGKNTTPELRVRQAAHALGLRFRLHATNLPGTPDLIFPSRNLAVFVHGCYWHRHPACPKASPPSSPFWATKFSSNVARDDRVQSELRSLGWNVVVIWECETKKPATLRAVISRRVKRRKVAFRKEHPDRKVGINRRTHTTPRRNHALGTRGK